MSKFIVADKFEFHALMTKAKYAQEFAERVNDRFGMEKMRVIKLNADERACMRCNSIVNQASFVHPFCNRCNAERKNEPPTFVADPTW